MGLALTAGCAPQPAAKPGFAEIAIHVTSDGFVPKSVAAPRGKPVTIVMTRETDETCAKQVVFAGMDEPRDLPLHRAVRIDFPNGIADTLRYVCGMGMEHGEIVAE